MNLKLWSIGGALLLNSTSAKADNWNNLQVVCQDLNIPQIAQFTQLARDWETNETSAKKDLDNLGNNLCPAYLQNPNAMASIGAAPAKGSVSLQQYVAEQSRTFVNALNADFHGKARQAFLIAQFKDLEELSKLARVNFSSTLCGRFIAERVAFISAELGTINEKILGLQKTCPQLAGDPAKFGRLGTAGTASRGQGAPTRMPAGASSSSNSSITGTIGRKNNL